MCGIFGIFGVDPARHVGRGDLDDMKRSLAHRGPDGAGFYTDGPLGIGMCRLSIIDLQTGDQPIANEDESVWVVFNGEIYNYRELTTALVAAGHRFRTASDTEVLVHLYEEYGDACVTRLRGMFSFAIWDRRLRTLVLARDRLGIKPLYYADTPHGLVFGSELKAIVECPWVSPTVEPHALAAYLRYGYVPDPLSILEGVAKLPPGHTLRVRDGRSGAPRPYWHPTSFFDGRRTVLPEPEAGERLWALMRDAVRCHLVSDVPVGAFLSGGVDSSAVVALMAQESGARVKTFSVGFEEDGYNELPYAHEVAEWFETEHHEVVVRCEDLTLLETVLAALDEPFSDASAIPTYVVSALARQHVKVALSGDGGDELFGGYDRYVVDHRRRYAGVLDKVGLGTSLRSVSDALPEGAPGKNYLYNLSLPRMERYLDAIAIFPGRVVPKLLERDIAPWNGPFPAPGAEPARALDSLSRLQDLDLRTYLPGDVLTKLDRMSMANSLEARVPLLDHPLVEFACSLPARLRLRSGETKYLLKRVLRGRVPEEVLRRPKQGFAVPLERWFSRRLPRFFHDMLSDVSRLAAVGVNVSSVRRLMDVYARKHRPDHCRQLWTLVVLDRFLRRLSYAGAR